MENEYLPKIGISIGDVNGVGMEVIIKSLLNKEINKTFTPVVYGCGKLATFFKKEMGLNDFNFNIVKDLSQINTKQSNMLNVWENEVKIELGQDTATGGEYAIKSLKAAVADLKSGKLAALVTAPINKNNVQSSAFNYKGHTDYLADEFNVGNNYAMMLVSDKLRVSLITEHVPVAEVSKNISIEKIVAKVTVINESLKKDFLIPRPIIALLGLNPHAGDNGLLGKEELDVIIPAINILKEKGIICLGPYSADGYWANSTYTKFDCTVAMYHDQGLIPFKQLCFDDGVNFTAGLPVVRTSPDHGTAYDIASKFVANENSMRQALYTAVDIAKNRALSKEWTADFLKPNPRLSQKVTNTRE
ncbi:MAG: 4-hydroxythreonine-4-phosphate dehydrogenase PdxA [Bacteroidia bacterium]